MRNVYWSALFLALTAGGCSVPTARSAENPPPPAAQPAQPAPAQPAESPPPAPPLKTGSARVPDAQGKPCPDGKCPAPLTCVSYYGFAGPRGPKFTSCEIPCPGGGKCPPGQTCGIIADGPGQVCRPTGQP
ncbi:MAG TPA: hypothetical protein VH877_08390 [Polyangia bacterium]|jgi:hypothetical protein|nr:hypothetical protein [Polyangia bacterium]